MSDRYRLHVTALALLALVMPPCVAGERLATGARVPFGAGPGPVFDLPTLWRNVDAVVFLRIQEAEGSATGQAVGKSEAIRIEYKASVLEVFRRFFGGPKTAGISFLQLSTCTWQIETTTFTALETPYRPGQECVAFLRWNDSEGLFQSVISLPVRDGQVKSPGIEEIQAGMKIEAFLAKLRAMLE